MGRDRAERGGQRAVGGRPIGHGLQRRQGYGIDPEALQGCELGSKTRAGAQPFFRDLGDNGDRCGVISRRELLLGDAGFILGRGERGFDLVDSSGESGEIGAGVVGFLRLGFKLRDSRRQIRNLALLGVDVGAQVLGLSRQTLGRFASSAIPGAGRFQRPHALVEVRCV